MIAVWYENNVGIDAGIHYWTSENDSYAFLIVKIKTFYLILQLLYNNILFIDTFSITGTKNSGTPIICGENTVSISLFMHTI